MSLEGLRGLLAEQALRTERNSLQQNQASQSLRQGVGVQGSQVTLSINAQSVFGARSLSNAFNQNLLVANARPNFSNPEPSDEQPLFDFEQVAQNVLRFVGGVITQARDSGADSTELESLFEQARNGVASGIASAQQDLGDAINDAISEGIENSRNRIEQGLQDLERSIFDPQGQNEAATEVVSVSQTVRELSGNSGDLRIRTRDGDEISLSFESLQAIQRDQSVIIEQARQAQNEGLENVGQPLTRSLDEQVSEPVSAVNNQDSNNVPVEGSNNEEEANGAIISESQISNEIPDSISSAQVQVTELRFQSEAFNLRIEGELDEQELSAIGELLNDVTSLADEFFNGDVETAFNQALELGFDEQELVGFALELNQVQQVQVVQAYESVSQFTDSEPDEDADRNENARESIVEIGNYLERLQRVFDERAAIGPPSLDEFVSSVLARAFESEALNDGLNRFNQFNQRLLDNLPNTQ